jgi:hypothetical protein
VLDRTTGAVPGLQVSFQKKKKKKKKTNDITWIDRDLNDNQVR